MSMSVITKCYGRLQFVVLGGSEKLDN